MSTISVGIWAMKVEPGKSYSQVVETDFHVTMAALGPKLNGNGRATLQLSYDKMSFALCTLQPNKVEQQPLNLQFTAGEEIEFQVSGDNTVYLTGNYVISPGLGDVDDDDDEDDDDENAAESGDENADEDDEEQDNDDDDDDDDDDEENLQQLLNGMDEDDEEDDEEEEEEELLAAGAKRKNAKQSNKAEVKKAKVEPIANGKAPKKQESQQESAKAVALKNQQQTEKKEQKQKKQPEQPKAQQAQEQQQKKQKNEKKEEQDERVKVLPSGLKIEDIEVGNGPKSKRGSKVAVRYIGRLASNQKVFDQNTSGSPFTFKLGAGQVIKGWDIGLEGMNTGGKRKITIPANLAYGARGAPPDIPPNATLIFEVKMLQVSK